jgi:3',5'-cyclic AMP phosphodiesterase CpdA
MRTLAHISDLHFGRHDPVAAKALCTAIATEAPDLVVVSGDLTQRARRAEFAAAQAFLARLPLPTLVIPGNHDVAPFFSPVRRLLRPFSRFERYLSPTHDAFFRDEEIAVLGLNTARRLTAKNGRVSSEQMQTMERLLAPLPEAVFHVLVTHHPLTVAPGPASRRDDCAGRARAALRVARAAGVRLLLSGHHHLARSGASQDGVAEVVGQEEATLVAHAGTAISTRTRAEPNSFNLIRIDRSRVAIELMIWSGGGAGFESAGQAGFVLGGRGWEVAPPVQAPRGLLSNERSPLP